MNYCTYCNREFEDEKILLQHQKAKHFKCHICHKKLYTGPGLQIHCMQVHKENIERVPNSIKGRDNISIEICGMDNIPEEDLIEHENQKLYRGSNVDDTAADSDSNDSDTSQKHKQPPLPNTPFSKQVPPGTIHGPLPHLPPMASNGAASLPPLPPPPSNPLMMMPHHPMMYNPMMMSPMMPHPMMSHPMMMPPSMIQSQPPLPAQSHPPPLMPPAKSTPQPLMGFNATPTGSVASTVSNQVKPLFPAALSTIDDSSLSSTTLTANLPNKIESLAPGSKIVHPEDDISLVCLCLVFFFVAHFKIFFV